MRRSNCGLQIAGELKNSGNFLCMKANMPKDLGILQKMVRFYTFYTPLKKGMKLGAFEQFENWGLISIVKIF